MFSAEIEDGTHFSSSIIYICKPSEKVQQYFYHLQSKMNENQPLDRLRHVWFTAGIEKQLPQKQTKPQRSSARE